MLGGIVILGVKNEYNYRGTEQPYADISLQLIIGENCMARYQKRIVKIMKSKNITCVKKIKTSYKHDNYLSIFTNHINVIIFSIYVN